MHTMPAPARILVRIVDSMAHRYEAPQEHAASPSVTRCGAVGLGMACQNAKDFPAIREWSLKPGIFIGEWWTLIICHCWSVRKTKAWRQSAATSSCMGTIQQVLKYLTNNSDIFGAVSAAPRKKKNNFFVSEEYLLPLLELFVASGRHRKDIYRDPGCNVPLWCWDVQFLVQKLKQFLGWSWATKTKPYHDVHFERTLWLWLT